MIQLFLRRVTLFSIFILLALLTKAQWYNPDKVNKKATALFETAYQQAVEGNYNNAIANLNDALKIDSKFLDALYARADMNARMKKYAAAVLDYESAYDKDSIYATSFLLSYASALAGNGNFEKALQLVNQFLTTPKLSLQDIKAANNKKVGYEFALQYAKKHSANGYVFNPTNMGDSINTTALEYLPSLTIDGNKMIFNRRINNDEDFYESDKINGVWQNAKPIAGKINTNLNEGAQNISQDGQWLIFTGCNYPEGYGSCDLYISYKNKIGYWSEAENMGNVINTDAWESSPSLSPDKRDLYFASTRAGGYGGSDIWVSHRVNGKWQKPENLGAEINTSSNESCPFIHADNQTLYFNSSGHPGYGLNDLFVSKRKENGIWQKPENLGYPINTVDDEGSLIVASNGKTAYYASDKADYKNKIDLYSFELRDDISALKTLWVKGRIFDKNTKIGLPSSVELTTLDSGFVISKLQADEEGNFLTTLPVGKNYAFNVNRKGYLFYSENFSFLKNFSDTAIVINIGLQPIEKGASIVLKNIFFESKKADLQNSSFIELDRVASIMTENPKLVIQISGHTDNVGKPSDNLLLSLNRAKAVVAYLLKKGITVNRLIGKGFGETMPIASNTSETGKAQNRRTELSVISN